jgi:hypothetical protein
MHFCPNNVKYGESYCRDHNHIPEEVKSLSTAEKQEILKKLLVKLQFQVATKSYFYVGKTEEPEERLSKHYSFHGCGEMLIVFTEEDCLDFEGMLIEHFQGDPRICNITHGSDGRRSMKSGKFYFTYVLYDSSGMKIPAINFADFEENVGRDEIVTKARKIEINVKNKWINSGKLPIKIGYTNNKKSRLTYYNAQECFKKLNLQEFVIFEDCSGKFTPSDGRNLEAAVLKELKDDPEMALDHQRYVWR